MVQRGSPAAWQHAAVLPILWLWSCVLSIGNSSCNELESSLTGSDWTLHARALLGEGGPEQPLKAGLSRLGQ